MQSEVKTLGDADRRRLWACLLPAMVLPFVASLFYFVILGESVFTQIVYGGTKVFTLVWPLVVVLFIVKGESLWASIRAIPGRCIAGLLPLAIAIGTAIVAAMFGLMQTPLGDAVVGSRDAIFQKAKDGGFLANYVPFAIFLTFAHSLLEEYYWRWFVFGKLNRLVSFPVACTLGAVAFAAHHLVVLSQFFPFWLAALLTVCVGIGGAIWSWLYVRQKTLVGAWVSHAIVDAGLMYLGYRLLFPA